MDCLEGIFTSLDCPPITSVHHRKKQRSKIYGYAKRMRHAKTKAEYLLWHYLSDRKMLGEKFRCQHVFKKRFIFDFYCPALLLAIEADGSSHQNKKAYDQSRDAFCKDHGIMVLRFSNDLILSKIENVLEKIELVITMLRSFSVIN